MPSPPPPSLPLGERLPVLDVIRGLALLGILVMNMPGFSSSFFAEADGSHLWTQPWDRHAEALRDMLFSGKFNSMFSLLFGLGFTVQYARMQAMDPDHATALYLRRLAALLAIGLVHGAIFWPGDVLHTYALLGLLLVLPLRNARPRTLVLLIGLGLLYPVVSGGLRLWLVTPEVTAHLVARAQAFEASNNAAYGHGSFWQAAAESMRVFGHFYSDRWSLWNALGWYVQLAVTMLLGMLAGRLQWVQRIPALLPQIRRLTWWSLGVGLVCGAVFTLVFELNRVPGPSPIKLLGGLCFWLSRLGMMVFYVLVVVRLVQHPAWQRRLAPLSLAGRMPLSNYLLQTAICTTLFNGWGLGLWGRVGPALGLLLALAIFFGLQLPWSRWWLARHARGPLEMLWARCTYGRLRLQARTQAVAPPAPTMPG